MNGRNVRGAFRASPDQPKSGFGESLVQPIKIYKLLPVRRYRSVISFSLTLWKSYWGRGTLFIKLEKLSRGNSIWCQWKWPNCCPPWMTHRRWVTGYFWLGIDPCAICIGWGEIQGTSIHRAQYNTMTNWVDGYRITALLFRPQWSVLLSWNNLRVTDQSGRPFRRRSI